MDWKLTPEKKLEFLNRLAESCNVTKACAECEISRQAVYSHKDTDPIFADGWQRAMKIGVGALEDEAHRRAFDGTMVATKNGIYQQYSDVLAIFLLKAHDPKYKETVRNELTGADGAPLTMTDDLIAAKLDTIIRNAAARRAHVEAPQEEPADDDYSDLV